jgi:hypothetical protein
MRARSSPATALVALVTVVVAFTAGCRASRQAIEETFDASRVVVDVHLERNGDAETVVAEFRPLDGGLHLYGSALPLNGIDGAGRPTRIDVTDASWQIVGPAQPSVVATDVTLAGFADPFPIYPDGPVTLRQGIRRIGGADDGSIDIAVTFMACSSTGVCYAPVEHHSMSLPSG